jgi:hypothetical protein
MELKYRCVGRLVGIGLDVWRGLARGLILPRIYGLRGLMLGGAFLSTLAMLFPMAQTECRFVRM